MRQITTSPCIRCGKPTRGSSPPERRACRECRRIACVPYGSVREQRICEMCGGPFLAYPSTSQRFCSKQCVGAWKHGSLTTTRPCEICGVQFRPKQPSRNQPGYVQRTCSRKCGVKLRRLHIYGYAEKPPKPKPPPKQYKKRCSECGRTFTALTSRRQTCGPGCARRRQSRVTSEGIMRRYYSDPEFRAEVNGRAHNRRAKALGLAAITSPLDLITYLMKRDHGRCRAEVCLFADRRIRAKSGPGRPSPDHIVPLSLGGAHSLENLQIAHLRCNLSKGNQIMAVQPLLVG